MFYHSLVHLPADTVMLHLEDIRKIKTNVGYFVTENFYYYGIVNSGTMKIVIGPTRQIPDNDQNLREMAFQADVPADFSDYLFNSPWRLPSFAAHQDKQRNFFQHERHFLSKNS